MNNWSFDIDRQTSWDLWCWVCLAAATALVAQAVLGRIVARRGGGGVAQGRVGIYVVLAAVAAVVLAMPALRLPSLGLVLTLTLLVALSISQYVQLRPRLPARRMLSLLSIRTVALLLAVPMLFEPVVRYAQHKTPDRPLLLLVDTSGSMSVADVSNGPTRTQAVTQALAGRWTSISDNFAPSIIPISSAPQKQITRPQQLNEIQANGPATDLVSGVAAALAQAKREDAEIVLISDGIDNTSADVVGAIRASRRPVHTVLVGSEQAQPAAMVNVSIERVDAGGEEWTVRSAATVKATVRSSGLNGRVVTVNLVEIDSADKPVGAPLTQTLILDPSPGGQEAKFDYTPMRTGVHRMRVSIDPIGGERSTVDNQRIFQQLATNARIKVLYVEGRARPEYRELSRALARDGNIEVATLLRVTGDRFAATGAIDGKPVDKVPVTAEQWRGIDVIVLGDLERSFLSPQQLQSIERAVSEGSGLVMLGGQATFGPGGYAGSSIETVLPVNMGDAGTQQDKNEFVPRLTTVGSTHAAMEGLAGWFGVAEKAGDKQLPTLLGNVVVGATKAGAEVLLTHPDGKGTVLAVHRYGKGRSAAFTADTTYRWYLPMRGLGQQSPYTVFWGQLVRWLAGSDVKDRGAGAGVEVIVDKTVFSIGESSRLRALVRDKKGDATKYAQVSLQLTQRNAPQPQKQTLPLTPIALRDGMYELMLANLKKGEWTAEVIATKDGAELGRQSVNFSVLPPADEMLKLAADPALMQQIATATGGYAYRLQQLPDLIDTLLRRGGPQQLVVQRTVPLHNATRAMLATIGVYPTWPTRLDLPMQTLLIVLLLTSEWVMRRRWQLM